MATPIDKLAVPTPDEIRNGILRTERAGLAARGVVANISPGGDRYIDASALTNELTVVHANAQVRADAAMPDTAEGEDLDRVAAVFGVTRRKAIGSSGALAFETTINPTLIAPGAQLVDERGNTFAVSVGGAYGDKSQTAFPSDLPVVGVSTGRGTNHAAGDYFTWISPPAGAANKLRASIPLTGGRAVEGDAELRARLLDRIKNPPAGGNFEQVIAWAEEANPRVDAAFVYPALDGPATYAVTVVGEMTAGTLGTQTRGLSPAVLTDVGAYLAAKMPQHCNLNVQLGTTDQLVDVAVGMTLPASRSASPPGPGGGWTDAAPWPALLGAATRVYVESVVSGSRFVLTSNDAATTPSAAGLAAGTTQIAWLDPLATDADGNVSPAFKVATVTAIVSSTTGHVEVEIDAQHPFAGIAAGHFVCPAAERIAEYGAALLRSMATLGPAQRTVDANRLPRSYRRPLTSEQAPSDLTSVQLRAVSSVGDEVLDVAWSYRSATSPTVPATTTDPVAILVPRYLGFYQL